jgi:hypothetical protein
LNGSTSGNVTLDAPAVSGNNALVLPTGNGSANQILRNGATAGSLEFTDKIVSGTAVASTSGTSIDFTGIPSWVKRVTVMFNGVSTNGSSNPIIQIGSGSITSSGYVANSGNITNAGASGTGSFTTGFGFASSNASNVLYVVATIVLIGSNSYVQSHTGAITFSGVFPVYGGGGVTLSGTLDRVRITTVNGTDTFDAGSINIMYE